MLKRTRTKHPMFILVFLCMTVFSLVACGTYSTSGSGSNPTATTIPTTVATPSPTPVSAPFKVSSVDLTVSPNTIAGNLCGSPASFTYTATFHIPAGTAGGTVQFMYTLNNGRGTQNASVTVSHGETTKVYTFTSSGMLYSDHTYPGIAEVLTMSPNQVASPQVKPAGTCTNGASFQVASIDMAVSPQTIAGMHCGTNITVTYTVTFHIAPNSPGGTIQFMYTINNGRGLQIASVTVSPGETTKSYSFTWSGTLYPDHVYPGLGGVITSSPNMLISQTVKPAGNCS